jgi:uncharacterized protein (TIGR03790 family)
VCRSIFTTILLVTAMLLAARGAWAGLNPQKVLVVVNARSSESLELGNLYRRAREIPYRQLLVLNTSTSFAVSYQTYLDEIEKPIRAYLVNQQLEDDVTCLVLTRGLPMQVNIANGRSVSGLLSALGLHGDTAARLRNPYAGFPTAFTHRATALRGLYMVTVLNGLDSADAAKLIAPDTPNDKALREARFIFQTSPNVNRAVHEDAQHLLTLRGYKADIVTAPPQPADGVIGFFSGGVYSGLTVESATLPFVPGALVDTAQPHSAAANNFDVTLPPIPLPATIFVRAGAAGVHGVIGDAGIDSIPMAVNEKLLVDRYTSGFTLAESFYAAMPYVSWQNVVLGDPLCAPYAQPPTVAIELDDPVARGMIPLRVSAVGGGTGSTISRLELYLDDRPLKTIYEPGNSRVRLHLGEHVVTYTLPEGATLPALIDGLTAAVNADPELQQPDGVRAVAQVGTGTLRLLARSGGTNGNDITVAVSIDNERAVGPGVTARPDGTHLAGGGLGPMPARAVVSFVGRRIKPGDKVTLQIQQERFAYTVPADGATMGKLLDALVALVEASPTLQKPSGVHAVRDAQGMPCLTLEARTPGEDGNQIPYQVTVEPTEGSQLKGYPEALSTLSGGQDGSAAGMSIAFVLGDKTAHGVNILNTTTLDDGYHRLRAVAYEGSPAQVQSAKTLQLLVRNTLNAPVVTLPEKLAPAVGEVTVPVTATPETTRVDLYIDGQLRASATARPFTLRAPLNELGRGQHDVWAVGGDAKGNTWISAPLTLEVLVPPAVTRIAPDHAVPIGETVHRVYGAGFTPKSTVRLAGIPVKAVTYVSPTILDVVCAAAVAGRGAVEVRNPDGTTGLLANGFEYYVPAPAVVTLQPNGDVLQPGRQTAFTAMCRDQYGTGIAAAVVWQAAAGTITPDGLYTAPATPGVYEVTARAADGKVVGKTAVTVGPAALDDGTLRRWLLLGPFPDPDNTALETTLIPEGDTQPSHGDKAGLYTWRSSDGNGPFVDLGASLTPNTNVAAYAHVYLFAPEKKECTLVFGSDDGVRVWLNSDLVYSLRVRRAANPDQTTLPVTLKAGWNRLMVKVDQGSGPWGFFLRLQRRDGKPLTGLMYSLDKP